MMSYCKCINFLGLLNIVIFAVDRQKSTKIVPSEIDFQHYITIIQFFETVKIETREYMATWQNPRKLANAKIIAFTVST